MKELSIEDKAKLYDESIKRVENIKTGKCETTFMFTEGLFEYVFPELKESDDERIRKVLVGFFKNYKEQGTIGAETFNGIPTENILAWLEKQGEQVLANSAKTCKDEQDNAWSEDDSAMLDNIIAWIEGKWGTLGGKVGGREAFISFLKSLKDRFTWKPSKRQKEALLWCVVHLGYADKQTLGELLESINKL